MWLLAYSSLSGEYRYSMWSSGNGLSWTFEGATDLPTSYGDLNYDMGFAGFVQNDRMWLLAYSSLSGEYRYSMWEL